MKRYLHHIIDEDDRDPSNVVMSLWTLIDVLDDMMLTSPDDTDSFEVVRYRMCVHHVCTDVDRFDVGRSDRLMEQLASVTVTRQSTTDNRM